MTNYDKLRAKLEEMFMLDRADLDFGIYRIMNAKRDEILRFLDHDLLPQVKQALQDAQAEIGSSGAEEIKQAEQQARALGVNPDEAPRVIELRGKYEHAADIHAMEEEVFNHLYSFFRRYYDEGDFLSLRRYKEGVYAIPYEGEEVKLHWANADQYYIKTAEHFRDYTFKVKDDKRVHFKLVDAQVDRDNNKSSEKRVFILVGSDPLQSAENELTIRFEYRACPDRRKQKEHTEEAVKRILSESPAEWQSILGALAPTEKSPNRTLLEKHLNDYTARNTFDYFIHKDLGGFLRRELDFYIKNEVMHLDDIENDTAPKVEQYLAKIRAIRRVAGKLITFLAQLEDFQKRLWLKRKFVFDTHYLITLDRVPQELFQAIAENTQQREAWIRLYGIDKIEASLTSPAYSEPLTIEFLNANPFLAIDTSLFGLDFRRTLERSMQPFEPSLTGLLIHGENFQVLSLLQSRFKNSLDCVYLDPPYNTDAGPIVYKNGYRSSTWVTMMANRIGKAANLLNSTGVLCATIDDYQVHELAFVLSSSFSAGIELGVAVIRNNPSGRATVQGFSICHEYAFFYGKTPASCLRPFPRTEKQWARFKEENGVKVNWLPFLKGGGAVTYRVARPKQYYPLFVSARRQSLRVPEMTWSKEDNQWQLNEQPVEDEILLLPIDDKGRERIWSLSPGTARQEIGNLAVRNDANGGLQVMRRHLPSEGVLPRSWWDKNDYAAREHGSAALAEMFGHSTAFSFAKAPTAVADCLWVSGLNEGPSVVFDGFGGSGTTAQAVIDLNRQDEGGRVFVLCEVESYFDIALKPRVLKSLYAHDWRNGLPTSRAQGVSACVKCLRIESYEDCLSNLRFTSLPAEQSSLIQEQDSIRSDYILNYMMEVEAAGSPSCLNTRELAHPFRYRLRVATDIVGETKDVNIDLVETFNWFLGLRVHTMNVIRGFHVITGRLPGPGNSEGGPKTLIIWRDVVENPNDKLDEFFRKQAYNTQDQEFDVIYVNGDNNLQNMKREDQTWKVRLIEEEFHRLMWDVEDI